MNRYLQAGIEIAREAGTVLLDEFRQPARFEYKGGSGYDLVTAADRRSEELIYDRLRTLFPQHAIEAEEGSRRESDSGYRWYVDPLDGTTNFAHRYPVFCVSMGLVRDDEIEVGIVHDPTRDETFYAARGQGAWLNQARIRVSDTRRLSESLLVTGFPSRNRHQSPNFNFYTRFSLLSHGVRRDGSAALDLCYVASGRVDGFWELNLKPWDVAAGALIAREAGGVVTDFSAVPFRLGGDQILASNGHIHPELRRVFLELAERALPS